MARGSVNIIERHLEKLVLGLAAAFLLVMAFLYLIRSPNRIDYGGQPVGPAELAEAIQRDAEQLRSAVRRAQPEEVEIPQYSEMLRQQHESGLFGATEKAPELPRRLRWAVEFGPPIPDLSEEEEPRGKIALVTPLPPTVPVARTGRNVVIPKRPTLSLADTAPPPEEEETPKEVELPWVSVGAYFDLQAQQTAMINAGYATYRSRVYVVGVDAQRQEMLADGSFSEWQDVHPRWAAPELELPEPEFDEITGRITNKEAIDRAYQLIKRNQNVLMQPPFFETVAGEPWKMPALEGYPDKEPEVARATKEREEKEEKQPARPRPGPRVRPRRGGGGVVSLGGGAAAPSGSRGGVSRSDERRQGREQAREDLKTAEEAYRNGQDNQALSAAQRVLDNEYARAGDKKMAQKIIRSIELLQRREQKGTVRTAAAVTPTPGAPPTVAGMPTPTIAGMGGGRNRPRSGGGTRSSPLEEAGLVTYPDKPERVAVWFHDDTVEAGKTYRYRLRVRLWNRYVGDARALKNPEQAKQVVLAGDWSLPGEPVTVPPSTYFFVSSASIDGDSARVDVWKWRRGDWLKQSFNVRVGDVIGGVEEVETGILDRETLREQKEQVDFTTGAVVLDLRLNEPVLRRDPGTQGEFALRESESLVLVYLDPADGQVKERVQIFDRNDPLLRKLRALAEEG